MRAIDANALLEFARNRYDHTIVPSDIKTFPTVDAVVVVRCEDCKHRSYDEWDKLYWCVECEYRCNNDDWFCAGGERRTNGKE